MPRVLLPPTVCFSAVTLEWHHWNKDQTVWRQATPTLVAGVIKISTIVLWEFELPTQVTKDSKLPTPETNAQQRPWDTCLDFWHGYNSRDLLLVVTKSRNTVSLTDNNFTQLQSWQRCNQAAWSFFPIRNIILWAKLADERVGVKDSFRYSQCSLPNSCTDHQSSSHMISHQVKSAQKKQENPPSCTCHCNTGMDCDQDVSTLTFLWHSTCSGPTNFFDKLCVFTLLFHNWKEETCETFFDLLCARAHWCIFPSHGAKVFV